MKFEADIHAVTIRGGASVNTKNLGSWTAGLNNDLKINAIDDMKNLSANTVYRFVLKWLEIQMRYANDLLDLFQSFYS